MPFFDELHEYCEAHTTPQPEILNDLERETHLKTLAPQMMSGHLQGHFLSLISQIMQPTCILEIGTFTGYSALCLAKGLQKNGVLHTVEANPELEYLIRKYIARAGLEDKIQLHIGDAKQVVLNLQGPFDIVFIDAGKADYCFYYDAVIDKLRSGGILLADNVLWSGKVLRASSDTDTNNLQAFNRKVHEDERVENTILPIRDGIMVVRKK